MNRIITKKSLANNLIRFEISTSLPLDTIKPGQYMVSRFSEEKPWIALPVVKIHAGKGTVVVVASASEESQGAFDFLTAGSSLYALQGPCGDALRIESFGTVVCIAREGGTVALLPILSALRESGNRVITLLSASSARGILLEEEVRSLSHETVIVTDDGSLGQKGSIGGAAAQLWRGQTISQVFIFGGPAVIRETHALAIRYQLPMQAVMYLNKDVESGLPGIFRVSVCRSAGSICVDGYNFNAYYANFEELIRRFEK